MAIIRVSCVLSKVSQPLVLVCGTRILRMIHGRDARATLVNCTSTQPFLLAFRGCFRVFRARAGLEALVFSCNFSHSVRHIDSNRLLSTTPHSFRISIRLLTSA